MVPIARLVKGALVGVFMNLRLRATVAITLALTAACAVGPSSFAPDWRLTLPLSDTEQNEILALAKRLDLGEPATITTEFKGTPPLRCEALRIESVPAVMGKRVSWKRVWVTNPQRAGWCHGESGESRRVGDWVADDRVQDIGAWRVPVDGGTIDVQTPIAIPYAHAAAIVAAVQDKRLIPRPRPGSDGGGQIPDLDAKSIFMMTDCDFCSFLQPALSGPALYKVYCRQPNVYLLVAVRGSAVELRFVGQELG